jgi:hypothetical protein
MTRQASEIEITDEMVQAGREVLVNGGVLSEHAEYEASFKQPPNGDRLAELVREVIAAALCGNGDRTRI